MVPCVFLMIMSWAWSHFPFTGPLCRESIHDDFMKWKHFPRYWPFVQGIHRSPMNSPYKGQWRGALMFSLICAWINGWVNNGEVGDLRRHRTHYDIIVMKVLVDSQHKCRDLMVFCWHCQPLYIYVYIYMNSWVAGEIRCLNVLNVHVTSSLCS